MNTEWLGSYLTTVSVDFTQAAWNTVASHRTFTVTGTVRHVEIYVVQTNFAAGAGATIAVGFTGSTSAYNSAQLFSLFTAGLLFRTAANAPRAYMYAGELIQGTGGGAANINTLQTNRNHGFTIAVNAFTGGTMTGYSFWTPVSANGNVVPATGGAL